MGANHGGEVNLLRHSLDAQNRTLAQGLQLQLQSGAKRPHRFLPPLNGPQLKSSLTCLLEMLARADTAALFILDGEEHLSLGQISALRGRHGRPADHPELLVGSLRNARPGPDDPEEKAKSSGRTTQCLRLRVRNVASYLAATPRKGSTLPRPLLKRLCLPKSERAEAENLALELLQARLQGTGSAHQVPQAILLALLDLVTVLARGSAAYLLVLDGGHLADAAKPRALNSYSRPASSLAKLSARTVYARRVKAEKHAKIRQLRDPEQERVRRAEAYKLAAKGGIKEQDHGASRE